MPSDRHRTHEARHVPHDAARNARFSIGVVNAAYIGIFSVGLHVVPGLDGSGGHAELAGELGQGEHAGVAESLLAAGQARSKEADSSHRRNTGL